MPSNRRDQETTKRSSIDRPSRLPHKKLKIDPEISFLTKEEEYHLREYEAIRAEYIEFNLSNYIINILSKATQNAAFQNLDEKKNTMKLMISTAKDLALNEMECALWTIYLQKINWKNECSSSSLDLIYTAYASKSLLNENLKPFSLHLEKISENFLKNYEDWYNSHKQFFKVDSMEINCRFKEYSKPCFGEETGIFDYNNCVDDILQSAGGYSSRDEDTTQSEEDQRVLTLREMTPSYLFEEKEESITPINPIVFLDTLSPTLLDDISKEKSPGTFNIFVSIPLLKSESSNISEFQMSNDETPDYGTISRANSNSTPVYTSKFPSINNLVSIKTAFEDGFPDF
ncbi:unnamed protein product [Blepharisma stoltei]|uniref:Uncharacterized protein n=1 Tax=Blepharisma stoltei TaxID=1481888 RepID=A0AAU9J5E0_9CILI|nr:unnamed protein product [Blepharisma stoltei]